MLPFVTVPRDLHSVRDTVFRLPWLQRAVRLSAVHGTYSDRCDPERRRKRTGPHDIDVIYEWSGMEGSVAGYAEVHRRSPKEAEWR